MEGTGRIAIDALSKHTGTNIETIRYAELEKSGHLRESVYTAQEVRLDDKSENGEGARPDDPAVAAAACGSRDRVKRRGAKSQP